MGWRESVPMAYLPHLVVLAERASRPDAGRISVGRMEFGPGAVPGLRDILRSTS